MSLLLQILAIYVAASLSLGLLLAVSVGRLIRRGDLRREQEVTVLARSRAVKRDGPRRLGRAAVGSALRRVAG